MVEEWTTCMRLLSWRRHQGTMLKNCVLILPVSDPAKQAAQVVKHHVFDERTLWLLSWRRHQGTVLKNRISILPVSDPGKQAVQVIN